MFERGWQYFINDLNEWLNWVINKQGELQKWEKVKAKLVPLTLQEDPAVRDIKLQLAAGNEISRSTAYRPLGINIQQERKLIMAEEDEFQEEMEQRAKKQEERMANAEALRSPGAGEQILNQQAMAQQQMGGMVPPGGSPAGPVVPGGAPPGAMPSGGGMGTSSAATPQTDRRARLHEATVSLPEVIGCGCCFDCSRFDACRIVSVRAVRAPRYAAGR